MPTPQFLLLQVRQPDDPMREQEVNCFANVLNVESNAIRTLDLLQPDAVSESLNQADIILIGGSGDYSVAEGSPNCDLQLEIVRQVCDLGKPTFGSCWGFQAIGRVLGGTVQNRPDMAEVGSVELWLTEAGLNDPIFQVLGRDSFVGQAGHEDCVVKAPESAIILASSDRVPVQAFRVKGKPIYCTQFHPELTINDLDARVRRYEKYVENIAGVSIEEFCANLQPSPKANSLLREFVREFK